VAIEKGGGVTDVNTSERFEVLEVAIPGDDVVRIACDATFQHHIIVRVVLNDRHINRRFYHMKRCENDFLERLLLGVGETEPGLVHHPPKFVYYGGRNVSISLLLKNLLYTRLRLPAPS
jgi:hypothetical protein